MRYLWLGLLMVLVGFVGFCIALVATVSNHHSISSNSNHPAAHKFVSGKSLGILGQVIAIVIFFGGLGVVFCH